MKPTHTIHGHTGSRARQFPASTKFLPVLDPSHPITRPTIMKHYHCSSLLCAAFSCFVAASLQPAIAAGVSVGQSSLIGQLHYSDSFTIGAGAVTPERQAYAAQTYPMPEGVDAVENLHGNPAQVWGSGPFSIATDASNFPTAGAPYPGTSGAGSDTGFTQRGGGGDWSIPYGLSSVFIIQFDYVQQPDRVDVSIGSTGGNIFGEGNLSFFIRTTDHPMHPEIGIFNAGVGESNTGLTSGIAAADEWNNYALRVDIPAQEIEIFTNEVSRGVLNLGTFNGGAYAPFLNSAFVGIGGAGNDRQWSDNFQVGLPIPEPGTAFLAAVAVVTMARRRRRR